MLIYKRNRHTKNESSILYRGRKSRFPLNLTGQTDRQTDGQTDISVYRVASPLKISYMFEEYVFDQTLSKKLTEQKLI